jgi:hypothetical protein
MDKLLELFANGEDGALSGRLLADVLQELGLTSKETSAVLLEGE